MTGSLSNVANFTVAFKLLDYKTFFSGNIMSFPDLWSIGLEVQRILGFTKK